MPDPAPQHGLTVVLKAAAEGDAKASAQLLPLVYDELRRLAAARLSHTPPGNTLQPTALVHEAYLRLVDGSAEGGQWDGRRHFFGAASRAMRDILVEQTRRKAAMKHGGGRAREGLRDDAAWIEEPVEDLLALDEALRRLEAADPRKAEMVMLRYFGGLTQAQAAEALGLSERTIEREWRFTRAWLKAEMAGESGGEPP